MNQSDVKQENLPGFRLSRFEFFNWGTFDQKIWSFKTGGANSLLTGDIGSGKSTMVDAITTLLVPGQRITYNKAAGAEGKERSLSDYVLGHYKKEKDDESLQARSISLREKSKALSILLAEFYDVNLKEVVTIAQVFWMREGKTQVERFFLISSAPLTIENDIYRPGIEVASLKRGLKATDSIEIFDTFVAYSAEMRRRMGIQSNQAIELFYQTVSMKSIGDLTEFVRGHMLDKPSIEERIDELCRNFSNLNIAHEAVLKARNQIQTLTPLVEESTVYQSIEEEIKQLRRNRDSLYSYMAAIEVELCDNQIAILEGQRAKTLSRLEKGENKSLHLEGECEKNLRDIEDNGGRRLNELEREIEQLAIEKKERQEQSDKYFSFGEDLGIGLPGDEDDFFANRERLESLIVRLEKSQGENRNEEMESHLLVRNLQQQYNDIDRELQSLRQRPSNIPARILNMRKAMCSALELDENKLPFVGELVEVKEEESYWEGAIERVLHNFGLSILVDDELYGVVSEYVNGTNLKGRLVYYRMKQQEKPVLLEDEEKLLIKKIRIKPDAPCYSWLETELASRFDYVCCEDIADFRHFPRAVTPSGQIKSRGVRHEKDDRYNINDRSFYNLGWKNEQKRRLLEENLNRVSKRSEDALQESEKYTETGKCLQKQRDNARDLHNINDFWTIDWKGSAKAIEQLAREKKEIEETSNILRTLKEQLQRLKEELEKNRKAVVEYQRQDATFKEKISSKRKQREQAEALFFSIDDEERNITFPQLEILRGEILKEKKIFLSNIDNSQKEFRSLIQRRSDNLSDQNKNRSARITGKMQAYKDMYPGDTTEVDADIEAANSYREILEKLLSEDLPRHEERFRHLLREQTIQDIALLMNVLEKEKEEILQKIGTINRSLYEIEYNRGSYIKLLPERSMDQEIRQFQEDLRLCLGESLSDDEGDIYTEGKFQQVKALIDRFQGRQVYASLDRLWTTKVTDVRNWFVFSASERWIEDDSEREFYSDSSGKSGGQKEKLAYTILAAALAFQFSLKQDDLWNKSFRFVMIDEAFGRGSDESARYGLELFRKLNLQLLIVTPLQKIHVIEKFIKTVHFVYQEENRSMLGSMTIEEFTNKRDEKNKEGQ